MTILLDGVDPTVAAGHDPVNVVVIKRNVEVQVNRAISQHILLQSNERAFGLRIDVTMPEPGAVLLHRVAHQEHAGWSNYFGIGHQATGDAKGGLVHEHLDQVRRRLIDDLVEVLDQGLKHPLGNTLRKAAADRCFGTLSQRFEFFRRNSTTEDEVPVRHELFYIELDHVSTDRSFLDCLHHTHVQM